MLGIPEDLYTPMFAVSRISGWCAHRIEELTTGGRIIRPAYRALPTGDNLHPAQGPPLRYKVRFVNKTA